MIESRGNHPSRDEVFIAKLSGYAAKQSFKAENKSTIQEHPSQELPEPSVPTPEITKPAISAVTPKAPGFDGALAVAILFTINLFKRRYN